MMKAKLKKSETKESDYLYRIAVECFGRTVEVGLTQKEFTKFKELGNDYLVTLKKRFAKRPNLKLHTFKKNLGKAKEAVAV